MMKPKPSELTLAQHARICKEALYRMPSSLTTPEALQVRANWDQELAWMKAEGFSPDISSEFLDADEGFRPPPRLSRTGSTNLIRANLESQWTFGRQMEEEAREERKRRDPAR